MSAIRLHLKLKRPLVGALVDCHTSGWGGSRILSEYADLSCSELLGVDLRIDSHLPATGKFCENLIVRGHNLLPDPVVGIDLIDWGSYGWGIVKDSLHQVLKLGSERTLVLAKAISYSCVNDLPELLIVLSLYETIVLVLCDCSVERHETSANKEKGHSKSENISSFTIIKSSWGDYFGSLKPLGSHLTLNKARRLIGYVLSSKTEVSNLWLEVLIKENVLRLEISMSKLTIMDVLQAIHFFNEDISAYLIAHRHDIVLIACTGYMSLQIAVLKIVAYYEGERQAKLVVDSPVYVRPITDNIQMLAIRMEYPRELSLID